MQRMTKAQRRRFINDARKLGADEGKSAASWVDLDEKRARHLLQMMDDGDPALFDYINAPNLSGEWSGDTTADSLASDIGFDPDVYEDGHEFLYGTLATEWEESSDQAFYDAVEKSALYYLEP